MRGNITINGDFPSGNIIVEKIAENDVYLHQDLRDTQGNWFFWAFEITGAQGRELTFHFTSGDVLGTRGACVSHDGGISWQWLGNHYVNRRRDTSYFLHQLGINDKKVLFAFCPLYNQVHLERFLEKIGKHPALHKSTFCKSRKGRNVEFLQFGNSDAKNRILLTSRHHACEATASYVLEGIISASLKDDDLGHWLLQNVAFAVIPFVDKDGVEDGDQGKNRKPHDHNRDYAGDISDSIYPVVRHIREWAPAWWAEGETGIMLDLHCPHIRNYPNEMIYFVGNQYDHIYEQVRRISAILENIRQGTLPYHQRDNFPYGKGWNSGGNYGDGKSISTWASEQKKVKMAVSLEIPYANVKGTEITVNASRALGHDLAATIKNYLE